MVHEPTRAGVLGGPAAVRSWQVQSSAVDRDDGHAISQPEYRATGWYDAPPRSTVMAALLHNGRFPDVTFSTRLRDEVDRTMFDVPWWFRTTFRTSSALGSRTTIRSDGIIPSAELWVNGAPVGGRDVIAGAYTSNSFDVTDLVRRGDNALAYLVYPGSPMTDLSIGWVDWNQWPPDNNMGIWRDVLILPTGPVRLSHPRVTVELSESLQEARLVVTTDVTNLGSESVDVRLVMALSEPGAATALSRDSVGAKSTERTVAELTLAVGGGTTERAQAETVLRYPAIWWPATEGDQPLYDLEVTGTVDGSASDRVSVSFGVRSLTSDVAPGGGRRFVVNGRFIPIRGAGWSPDLFLRHDSQRIADELSYSLDIGLNTIRLEGKGENPEFFEMADEAGLLVLPGWECCDKWEAHAGTGGSPWGDHDFDVAQRSMEAEAYRLANHPSVIGFVIGSDFPPETRACRAYLDVLERARWDLPIISSATVNGTEEAGPSGMKMTGPYAWVPPVYWYSTDPELGGAVGFNSETSAGNNVPRLSSLDRMLSAEELEALWNDPPAQQFHAGPPSEFDNLEIFHSALAGRYGAPRSLRDFVAKAQLASYEATRAQFEAYGGNRSAPRPATGIVYWMLNSAWPSLNWQLWDHFLDPSGAYFGTKKANEPLHVQYAYDERAVDVVNRTRDVTRALLLSCRLRSPAGVVLDARTVAVGPIRSGETARVMRVELPDGVPATYFLELDLGHQLGTTSAEGSETVSRNVYWLSTTDDVLALDQTTWQYTPTAGFADLRGLEALGAPQLEAAIETAVAGGRALTSVTIRNLSSDGTPAVGVHATLLAAAGSAGMAGAAGTSGAAGMQDATDAAAVCTPVVPVLWSDNDIVLFEGQSATLTAACASAAFGDAGPLVEIDAFNLAVPLRVRPPAK
jgi:exo-1,4-beta-D-glucosaminidase